ncbi:toxin [Bdellovibrionota bacterium FG-1]
MKRLTWKPEKNEWLKEERGISFEEIEDAIRDGGLRDWYSYKGTKGIHAGQIVLVVEVDGDEWRVPVTVSKTVILMRTAY